MAKEYFGIVQNIVREGRHGPYFVVSCSELSGELATCALTPPIWQETDWPEEGMYVVLSEPRKKRGGWRFQHGRHVTPSDEQNLARRSEQ